MRDYKFRGFSLSSNEWKYGSLYTNISEDECSAMILVNDTKYEYTTDNNDIYALAFNEDECYVVVPDSVGEFIGLYDIHGNEIYENDVIEYEDSDGNSYRNIIKHDGIGIMIENEYYLKNVKNYNNIKVVGNIYQDNKYILGIINEVS